jgi:hypothetical protein
MEWDTWQNVYFWRSNHNYCILNLEYGHFAGCPLLTADILPTTTTTSVQLETRGEGTTVGTAQVTS